MPLYYFKCPTCSKDVKKILSPEDVSLDYYCPEDKTVLVRNPQDVSSSIKEVIDNGLQPRKVEQYADSAELIQEREDNARKEKLKNDL